MDEDGYVLLPGDRTDPVITLRTELIYLWSDLASAYRYSRTPTYEPASPPEHSLHCLHLIDRIRRITRIIGPVDRNQVEAWFLETGIYEQVHATIEIPKDPPDDTDDLGALQALTAAALTTEHHRRAREQVVASPEEHQDGFAGVVVEAIRPELERLRDRHVRAVQNWMALDLHTALGLTVDHEPDAVHQGRRSWGDWWAELLSHVRPRHPC